MPDRDGRFHGGRYLLAVFAAVSMFSLGSAFGILLDVADASLAVLLLVWLITVLLIAVISYVIDEGGRGRQGLVARTEALVAAVAGGGFIVCAAAIGIVMGAFAVHLLAIGDRTLDSYAGDESWQRSLTLNLILFGVLGAASGGIAGLCGQIPRWISQLGGASSASSMPKERGDQP